MATSIINIRTEKNIKELCEELFENLGMNMSTAINIFLRQSLRVNGIPFEIKSDIPNEDTLNAFKEGEKILRNKKSKGYKSIADLKKALDL